MSNPDEAGFLTGQADPEHLHPPVPSNDVVAGGGSNDVVALGGIDDVVIFGGGGKQAQGGKNKRLKDITAGGGHDDPPGLSSSSKPKTRRKPDPSAANVTDPCSECGRRFWSQKALFGHMRCHPERHWRGVNPPPHLRLPQPPCDCTPAPPPTTPRPPPPQGGQGRLQDAEREVATCLVMMANGPATGDPPGLAAEAVGAMGATETPTPPPSLSQAHVNCRFECSSCKKVFGSHQALGGHRASHKNVKGCFAMARNEGEEASLVSSANNDTGAASDAREGTVLVLGTEEHRCKVCSRAFPSGQALGGHKRRHWERGEEQEAFSAALRSHVPDLNLPPPDHLEKSGSSAEPVLDLKLGI